MNKQGSTIAAPRQRWRRTTTDHTAGSAPRLPCRALALALGLLGCDSAAPLPGDEEIRAQEARLDGKEVPAAEVQAQAQRSTAFALALHQELRKPGGNLFYSPYSISTALTMTYAGTAGSTAQQLEQVLGVSPQAHAALNVIDQALNSRGQGQAGKFQLTTANALFAQRSYPYQAPFLGTLARYYGAGLRPVDFAEAPEAARGVINGWVSRRTEARIPELLPQGAVTSDTRLVLTNAVYFKAAWLYPFEKTATMEGQWKGEAGPLRAPLMQRRANFGYASDAGVDVVELPYQGDEVSLIVLAPPAGQLGAFEQGLTEPRLSGLLGKLRRTDIQLTLPKFQVKSAPRLKEALVTLGVRDAFAPGVADLSGMDGTRRLYVQDVVHKAVIDLNEDGTEAAAATGVVIGVVSVPPAVVIDRPFVYLIRDRQTGAVVFVGRLVDPRAT